MKQCQECSYSESQDWNSQVVCDNGVTYGMGLCAVQKDGPPDDVGLDMGDDARRALGPCASGHSGESYQIIVTRWRPFDVEQHVIRCSLSEE